MVKIIPANAGGYPFTADAPWCVPTLASNFNNKKQQGVPTATGVPLTHLLYFAGISI